MEVSDAEEEQVFARKRRQKVISDDDSEDEKANTAFERIRKQPKTVVDAVTENSQSDSESESDSDSESESDEASHLYTALVAKYNANPKKYLSYCRKKVVAELNAEDGPDEDVLRMHLKVCATKLSCKAIIKLAYFFSDVYCSEAVEILAKLTKNIPPPTNLSFPQQHFVLKEMKLFQCKQ